MPGDTFASLWYAKSSKKTKETTLHFFAQAIRIFFFFWESTEVEISTGGAFEIQTESRAYKGGTGFFSPVRNSWGVKCTLPQFHLLQTFFPGTVQWKHASREHFCSRFLRCLLPLLHGKLYKRGTRKELLCWQSVAVSIEKDLQSWRSSVQKQEQTLSKDLRRKRQFFVQWEQKNDNCWKKSERIPPQIEFVETNSIARELGEIPPQRNL